MMERKIRRGEIYIADLDPVVGSEQGGERPVLVIQNNVGNTHSPTVIVLAITSRCQKKKNMPTHIPIESSDLSMSSIALAEHRTAAEIDETEFFHSFLLLVKRDLRTSQTYRPHLHRP